MKITKLLHSPLSRLDRHSLSAPTDWWPYSFAFATLLDTLFSLKGLPEASHLTKAVQLETAYHAGCGPWLAILWLSAVSGWLDDSLPTPAATSGSCLSALFLWFLYRTKHTTHALCLYGIKGRVDISAAHGSINRRANSLLLLCTWHSRTQQLCCSLSRI